MTTTITTAAPIAQTPSALMLAPQRLTRSLSDMTQLSIESHGQAESVVRGLVIGPQIPNVRNALTPSSRISQENQSPDKAELAQMAVLWRDYVDKVFENIGISSAICPPHSLRRNSGFRPDNLANAK
jgi:hypothetical protein